MTPPGTVNAADQARLISYLQNNGGNLYTESVNIGIDHFGTEFLETLGIKFKNDGDYGEVAYLTSQSEDLVEDIDFEYGGGDEPHYSVDEMLATSASVLYKSEEGFSRMFYLETDDYKAISGSVVIGAFQDSDSLSMKTYLMAEIVNYFLGITTITDIREAFAGFNGVEVKAWPNPFTDQINISFDLDKTSDVSVHIFDDAGRVVNNLFDGNLPNGNHSFVWAGNSLYGDNVNNGIYFYNININGKSKSGKIILAR